MKRKTLTGIIAGTGIGIVALIWTMCQKNNAHLQVQNSRYVAEFVDRDKDGQFDSYKVLKITGDKKEYVTTHYHSWLSQEDHKKIYFNTPFGATMQGEFDKEYLKSVYKNLSYPDVDEIRFIE